jgi:hypothetical protein
MTGMDAGADGRRWAAALALVATLATLATLCLGCAGRDDGSSPEAAVQSLIAAARAGDRLAVYQRFGPRTRARIDDLLASAHRTGATRILRPEDLVTVGWVPPAWEAAGTRLVHRDGDDAEVEVYSGGGDRQSVRVVREAKSWKVELPLR